MAYSPTNWANGDVITADKLNGMDFVVTLTLSGTDTVTADKTVTEVIAALTDGKNVRANIRDHRSSITEGDHEVRGIIPVWDCFENRVSIYVPESVQNNYYSVCIQGYLNGEWLIFPEVRTFDFNYISAVDGTSLPFCEVMKFNHTDPRPYWDTIEYQFPLDNLLAPLLTAACSASAGGKTTLGSDVSAMGETAHYLGERANYVMSRGQGAMLQLYDNNNNSIYLRVTSVFCNPSEDSYVVSASGRINHDFSTGKSYDITLEVGAKRTDAGGGEYTYEAYTAVTAEEITITFVS